VGLEPVFLERLARQLWQPDEAKSQLDHGAVVLSPKSKRSFSAERASPSMGYAGEPQAAASMGA
jgi:hypothetical protein